MRHQSRFIYLLYYIKELDILKLRKFLDYATKSSGRSKITLLADSLSSSFRFNISILDYFNFRFYSLSATERSQWAGTGFMYEYQLKMNPEGSREVLADKIKFLNHFSRFIRRHFYKLQSVIIDKNILQELLKASNGRLVLKGSRGQIGAEVEVINTNDYSPELLIGHMAAKGYDLIEEYIIQHKDLMELSPSGLNTVRIITQLNGNQVEFIAGRLRISVNSHVDNMAAGNLAAAIDLQTGTVIGNGVYSDITKPEQEVHPVTGKPIKGFMLPFWDEVTELAKNAAFHTPENRSVGWDIAITPDGPELIEGNHNWCKLLWQLPVKRGLKSELEKYL
jgi:hypothetical protein